MHSSQRSNQLTANATARLTPQEEERIKDRAQTLGLTKSGWCRKVLLEALDASPDARILLSELSALRAILLTLQSDSVARVEPTQERLKQLVEKAEREKFAMADKRIHAYRSQQLTPASANGASTES